jgi:small subunit ribosomal protein S7
MPRRKAAEKRERLLDSRYNDPVVSQFIGNLMGRGKKSTAETIIYSALDYCQEKTGTPGLDLFHKALNNIKPVLEVKSRRVGGATYQVPVEVRASRRTALAIRWVILYSRDRSEKTMAQKLASELMAAANNEGSSIKKKEDTHKMAEANKAFAHFRW